MKLFVLCLLVLCKILTTNAKIYSEDDIYITHPTSFDNISTDCRLFGRDYQRKKLVRGIHLNITEETLYWIGARMEFSRKYNPFGGIIRSNCKGKIDADKMNVEDCAIKCVGRKYFTSNNATCTCLNAKVEIKSRQFERSANCEKEQQFCSEHKCILYENDGLESDYGCEAYKSSEDIEGKFYFRFTECLEQKNYGYICGDGVVKEADQNISWYEAYQHCKNNGSQLLLDPAKLSIYGKKSWYWVSFLRRTEFILGKDFKKPICVAARIQTDGNYTLESQFCNKNLEALCHSRHVMSINDGSSKIVANATVLGIACGAFIILTGIIVMVVYKKSRGHLRIIPTSPQEDIDNSPANTDEEEDETFSQNRLQLEVSSI